jgi:hypothetical protein
MKTKISFCPLCAATLEATDDDQFECEDCEKKFFIQIAEDEEDEEDEDEEEEDEDDRDEEDEDEEEDSRDDDDDDEY